MMVSVFDMVENIVVKGENAGYQHFFTFPTMHSKAFFLGVVKSRDCVVCWMYGVKRRFQGYFSYISAASAPIYAFLQLF